MARRQIFGAEETCELNAWQVNAGRNPVLLAVAPIVDKSSGRANLGLVGSRMHFWPQMQISFGHVRILFPFPFCRVSQLSLSGGKIDIPYWSYWI